jgi:hypothetical protein
MSAVADFLHPRGYRLSRGSQEPTRRDNACRRVGWGFADWDGASLSSSNTTEGACMCNGPEQPSIRPESSRSQSELGSARSRSGRRDGAIRRIFGSGYHRNARKQSERGVSSSLILSLRGRPATERSLPKFTPGGGSSLGVSRQRGSDDRMPEERGERSNHNNAKDKTPRVEAEGLVV